MYPYFINIWKHESCVYRKFIIYGIETVRKLSHNIKCKNNHRKIIIVIKVRKYDIHFYYLQCFTVADAVSWMLVMCLNPVRVHVLARCSLCWCWSCWMLLNLFYFIFFCYSGARSYNPHHDNNLVCVFVCTYYLCTPPCICNIICICCCSRDNVFVAIFVVAISHGSHCWQVPLLRVQPCGLFSHDNNQCTALNTVIPKG
jgi:hypothetical protein